VGNDETGASAEKYLQCALDFDFRQTVYSTCGLIKNENLGISQHGAGDADKLPLARRNSCPVFEDDRVEAESPRVPCGNRGGLLRRVPYLGRLSDG